MVVLTMECPYNMGLRGLGCFWASHIMRKLTFESVTVETRQIGKYRSIASVKEAAEFLSEDWPARHGPSYLAAQQICHDALNGERTVGEARKAFIAAAKTVDIFVQDRH